MRVLSTEPRSADPSLQPALAFFKIFNVLYSATKSQDLISGEAVAASGFLVSLRPVVYITNFYT